MARLQKFSGAQALPGVGNPRVVADTAVGAATAELGPQIGRSVAALGELTATALNHRSKKTGQAARAEDLTNRKNAFTGKKAAEHLQTKIRDRLEEPRSWATEAPVPLADEMVSFMKSSADRIWSGLPEEQRLSFDMATKLGEDQLRTEIAFAETSQDKDYFLDGISQTKDLAVETVSRQPDRIDQVFDHYLDLVDTAALPDRLKEQSIQDAGQDLLETWVQAHPAETQIAELSKLQARKPIEAISNSSPTQNSGSSMEEQTEFSKRADALPEVSRNRLLAAALKQRTESSLVELARIAGRIDGAHEHVDPLEISGNALLGTQARLQLLGRFREAVDARSRQVAALEQLAVAGSGSRSLTGEQGFAHDAFSYLNDGKADPAVLMHGIAVSNFNLPRIAAKALVKTIASENSQDVAQAFRTLSVLKPDAINDSLIGAEGAQIRMLLAGGTYLTAEQGLSTEAIGTMFSNANQLKTRKARLENFAALYPGRRNGKTTASPSLG